MNETETPKPTELKVLPLASIREGVIFPHVEMVLTFGRKKSQNAIMESFATHKQILFTSQKKSNLADPAPKDLYEIGVLCEIERILKSGDEINALVRGVERVKLSNVHSTSDMLMAEYEVVSSLNATGPEIEALSRNVLTKFKEAVNMGKGVEFLNFMKLIAGVDSDQLSNQIAVSLDIVTKDKQAILESLNVKSRLELILKHLVKEVNILEIERNITAKTQKKFDKSMRENILRERLKTIQKELGEGTDEEQEIKEFKQKVSKLELSKTVRKKVVDEINRLSKLSEHSPEYSYIRSWLETVVELPWGKKVSHKISIKEASDILNNDHFGLIEVKERIVEYLSVLQLKERLNEDRGKNKNMPTILCFAGPPGVGKTSIGKSIAKALGREFIKVSLGGIRDEAEIRGHRRTYVGAMPGRIIQGIKDSHSSNPVFMLDEIDKIGLDYRGDPSAALLEALDPEQNHEFSDHYLDVPFDLSDVIFITTANVLDTIPPALLDRLEVIEFSGYTLDEKYHIAIDHLYDKCKLVNGLSDEQIGINENGFKIMITRYTREAGVRNLERVINKVMRKVAKKIADNETKMTLVTPENIQSLLGPYEYPETFAEKKPEPGLVTGLAWTQAGGDILFIEVAVMPGSGQIQLTGKLGEVMQESAKAAWSYVRTRWKELKLNEDFYKSIDVHVHVPEGAVPKDGPSAGDTIATALVSAITHRPVRTDLAMTGEVTLRGRILEIGGVKEKVIAAHRAGIRNIILPAENEKDLVKVPEDIKKVMKFYPVSHMDEVLKIALI